MINTAYSPTVTFTAAGLAGTYTWAATGVPSGMAVSSAGVFSGTPTVSGAQSMAVTGTHTSGCQATRTYTFTITVPPPVVTTSAGTTAFTEDGPAVIVDGGVTTSSAGTTTLASATISISGGFQTGQDLLVFVNAGAITGNYVAATGVLTLTGVDTLANYQTALRSITYNNSSQNPNTATNRTVSFVVNNGSASSAATTKTVSVTAVNDAPVVTTSGGTTAYLENGVPLAIDTGLTVTDIDSTTLTGATIQITGNYANGQDLLSFTNIVPITGSAFVAATGTLTLSGTDTVANYQAALRTVKYSNSSDNPSSANRTVTFQVNDGGAVNNLSNLATKLVSVTPVNDPPTANTATVNALAGIPVTYAAATLGGTDIDGNTVTVDTVAGATSLSNLQTVTLVADGSFTVSPAPGFSGAASFQYRVKDNGGTANGGNDTSLFVTVTVNVNGPATYYVLLGGAATATCGNLGNDCTLAQAVTNIGAATGKQIFIRDAATHTANVTLPGSGKLYGQGMTGAFATVLGYTAAIGSLPAGATLPTPLPATGLTRPVVTSAFTTVTVGFDNTLRGFNVTGVGGIGGSGYGTLTASEINVTTTGTALNLSNGTGTPTFDVVTSTGGANNVLLTNVAGTLTMNGGALSGATGDAFLATTGTGNITYAGTIASGNAHSININGKTGGTVLFSGAITDTDTGISLTSNTGATINFTGGISATTGANAAFTATGGGTVSATQNNTSIFNTLTTTTATALNVVSTTIGASGLTFRSISSSGGTATGIILDTTGSSGGLTVTGDGTNTTRGGNATGGTIANKDDGGTNAVGGVGTGIFLNSTQNVTLRRMTINGINKNYGIRGTNVTNFVMQYSSVIGTNGDDTPTREGSVIFDNVFGNANSIFESIISGSIEDNLRVENSSGTLTSFNITNNNIQNNSTVSGNIGVRFASKTTGNMTGTISNNSFSGNRTETINSDAGDSSTLNITITGNTIVAGTGGNNQGNLGINVTKALTSNATFDVSNNKVGTPDNGTTKQPLINTGINIFSGSSAGTMSGKVTGNIVIQASVNVNPGSGIVVNHAPTSTSSTSNMYTKVDGNQVGGSLLNYGIFVDSGGITNAIGSTQAQVTNNVVATGTATVPAQGAGALDAIRVAARRSTTACYRISGNTASTAGALFFAFYLRKDNAGVPASIMRIEGLALGLQSDTTTKTYIGSTNTITGPGVGADGPGNFYTGVVPGNCSQIPL